MYKLYPYIPLWKVAVLVKITNIKNSGWWNNNTIRYDAMINDRRQNRYIHIGMV